MPENERPIPFSNMIYIGDGLTDVPCMTVTKNNGGHAVAVHKPNSSNSVTVCRELAHGNRIDYFAPANYEKGKKLEKRVKLLLDVIVSNILFEKEKFSFQRKVSG